MIMSEMAAANSMVVLEQGDTEHQPQRPKSSGRVSINKVPFKRSGSSLEIIQPEPDEDGDSKVLTVTVNNNERPPSRPSSSRVSIQRTSSPAGQSSKTKPPSRKSSSSKDRPPSRPSSKTSVLQRSASQENVRQSQSGGSSRKKFDSSSSAPGAVSGDVQKVLAESDGRSSSAEARLEGCGTPKKQVFLPSVRRNYEQHGMPKDDTLDVILRESLSSPAEQAAYQSNPSNSDKGTKENIDALLERLSMRVDGSKLDGDKQERKGSGGKKKPKSQSMPSTTESTKNNARKPSTTVLADTDAYYTSPGTEIQIEEPQVKAESGEETSSDEDDSDDEEDEGPKAPIELLGEFVEAVMDEAWEDAEKLCKMVLIYEPDNAEAKQFQPLIEEMLKQERHEQLYGSGSDDEESSDEDDSEEDDDDDEDDEDSDEESSSSGSESEEENEKDRDTSNKEAEKRDREAKMMAAMQSSRNDELR